jgi:DNA-binding beta-propeller fold protein YncE
VLPLPGGKELLVTDGDTATVRFVDQRSGATRATVTVGGKPDAAIWDARRKQAVVMSARGGSVEFIDPATAKVKASVPLAPFLESAAFDREACCSSTTKSSMWSMWWMWIRPARSALLP